MMRQRSNTSPILRLTRNLICIGIAAFLILFTQNEQFCKKIIPTTNEQLETYSDIKQIAARLEEEILSGSGSFSFYTTRLDPSQIQDINSYIDPTFGSANYQETTNNRLAPKTTIKIQLKPAYYVYAAIMQHKAIPNNETKAKRLYRVVNAVLKAKIKPAMTDYQKELALHDYLVKQCHYSTHSTSSDVYEAYGALVNHKAVCDGYAQALQLLFTCSGITSKYICGTATDANGSMDHAWNLVKLGNDWYHLDATWDDPTPDRKGRILHTYFNVTDSYIKSSHHFNASYYPTMTATKMNFYVRSKQRFTSWKKYKKAAKKALLTDNRTMYEAYIGKRNVTVNDLQFLYSDRTSKQFLWNVIKESEGNVLVITQK